MEKTPQDRISSENLLKEEALRFRAECNKAEQIGMRLIARAEQTQKGLSQKLKRRKCKDACIQAVVARFVEIDLINDERYAERWLRSRLSRKTNKNLSPRLLSLALSNRGISREDQKNAFDRILDQDAEYKLLLHYMAREKAAKIPKAYSIRSHLKYEGFSSSVINLYFDETESSIQS